MCIRDRCRPGRRRHRSLRAAGWGRRPYPHGAADAVRRGLRRLRHRNGAAAWGGTTTIVDYAGHDYGEPLLAGLARWRQKAAKSHLDHGLHMMVREVNDRVLAELPALVAAGVSSIKLFMAYPGVYMVDDAAIFRVLGAAREYGVLVAMHAEHDAPIAVLIERHVAAGDTAPIFHARSRPAATCRSMRTSI